MRAGPASRPAPGPFVVPGRLVLLDMGLLAVGLGVFDLFHELHAGLVDVVYTIAALVVAMIWLVSIIVGYLGARIAVFVAGAIAFVEFGLTTSNHFQSGPGALSTYVTKEGLPLATVDMAIVPVCLMVVLAAAVCWTHPRGHVGDLTTLPLLVAALAGSVLVILQATDNLHRADVGRGTAEDFALFATVLASAWLAGGFWIARVRRTGALLIAASTFGVCYSFVSLHLVKGSTPISTIVSDSGAGWAIIAAAAVVLAGASFLVSMGLLAWSFVPRKRAAVPPATQPVRRGA